MLKKKDVPLCGNANVDETEVRTANPEVKDAR